MLVNILSPCQVCKLSFASVQLLAAVFLLLLLNKFFSTIFISLQPLLNFPFTYFCHGFRIRIGCSQICFGSICLLLNKTSNESLPSCVYLLFTVVHPECICILSLHYFNCCMASFCIRVDAANEAVWLLSRSRSRKQESSRRPLTPLTCKASPRA